MDSEILMIFSRWIRVVLEVESTRHNVKKIPVASMRIVMSHKGLDCSPMSQMVRSHVKKLADEIDVLDQSEEGLHQRKGSQSLMNGIET